MRSSASSGDAWVAAGGGACVCAGRCAETPTAVNVKTSRPKHVTSVDDGFNKGMAPFEQGPCLSQGPEVQGSKGPKVRKTKVPATVDRGIFRRRHETRPSAPWSL